ncbi:MAG: glucose-6-phosphate isomerase [Candidatus Diapherotrites archaeon]|nr:glucose-6-phosphate isomerase [Candidatus Diapherotrites archaeon]
MINLSNSGLPISLNKLLEFDGQSMQKVIPDIRTIQQMKPVLMNSEANSPANCYFMYRDTHSKEHKEKIHSSGLRFDLTLIPSAKIGNEFNKTFGHFHPKNPAGVHYPEIYEVIHGKALYLLQSIDSKKFIAVTCLEGEKIIIPPGFGHVTINPSNETLVMANWIEATFKSDYGNFKEKHGAMYYFTEKGFEKNKNYSSHVEITECKPKEFPELGITTEPMYLLGTKKPEVFDYLIHPEKFEKEFKEYLKLLLK